MAGAKASGDSGVITSESHTNIENELSSNTSEGSWLQFSKTSLFRFPLSVNVLMWLGCVVMLFLSSLYTVEYVGRCVLMSFESFSIDRLLITQKFVNFAVSSVIFS